MRAVKLCGCALAVLVLCAMGNSANAKAFSQGDNLMSGGVGIFLPGVPGHMTFPSVGAGFEYGFHDLVSGGGFFALSGAKAGSTPHLIFSLSLRANFHALNLPVFSGAAIRDKLDLYVGPMIGVNAVVSYGGTFLWGAVAGGRYYFTPTFGAYLEAGRGIGWVNGGVTFLF
jgi:hypothetical protein